MSWDLFNKQILFVYASSERGKNYVKHASCYVSWHELGCEEKKQIDYRLCLKDDDASSS